MSGRLPAAQRVTLVGVDAGGLDAHEQLPGPDRFAEFLHRPGGTERCCLLGQADMNIVRQWWAARTAGDKFRLPTKHVMHKTPRIVQCRLVLILSDMFGDLRAVDLGLPGRGEAEVLQQDRRDDKPNRPDVIQPFEIGIALYFSRHGDQRVTGQR
jgi:hypothetical protein